MERTIVFWFGLTLLSLASVVLFGIVWMVAVVMYPANRIEFLKGLVPIIVGAFVFLFIGISMMKSSYQATKPRGA